jgi:hypothetical protein
MFSFVSTQGGERPNFRQRRVVAVTADRCHAKFAPDALHCIMPALQLQSRRLEGESSVGVSAAAGHAHKSHVSDGTGMGNGARGRSPANAQGAGSLA